MSRDLFAVLNSDFNAFRSKKSCLGSRSGYKWHFHPYLCHSSKPIRHKKVIFENKISHKGAGGGVILFKRPLIQCYLLTTATNLGSRMWSLKTGWRYVYVPLCRPQIISRVPEIWTILKIVLWNYFRIEHIFVTAQPISKILLTSKEVNVTQKEPPWHSYNSKFLTHSF